MRFVDVICNINKRFSDRIYINKLSAHIVAASEKIAREFNSTVRLSSPHKQTFQNRYLCNTNEGRIRYSSPIHHRSIESQTLNVIHVT